MGYERDEFIPRKTVGAQKLILDLLKERAETGRLYIMNIDHCNSHSSFKDKVEMSNLCQEITLPTYPLQHIDDEFAEIALCILSAINVGKVKSDDELEDLCDLAVRGLEELIDYQDYPINAAEIATKARRSLGIGFIGLDHYLAKLGYNYDSQEAWDAVHGLSESFQYYLLKASNQLAKEKGHCEYFGRTKYAEGILPIDTYKKDVDEISSQKLAHDWEGLRASILESGLRHSTLSAQMPSESSSVVSNATNGIEIHPVISCPLRRVRRDRLSKLFHLTVLSRTTILFSGICLTIGVILMWSQSCRSSLIRQSVETGPTIQRTIPIMKSLCP